MSIPDFLPLDQFRNLDWMSSRFPRPDRISYMKDLAEKISNIQAILGVPEGDRNMGEFNGEIIPDNTTLKVILQVLENRLADIYTEAPVIASEDDAVQGTNNTKVMTPLRVTEAIASKLSGYLSEREGIISAQSSFGNGVATFGDNKPGPDGEVELWLDIEILGTTYVIPVWRKE